MTEQLSLDDITGIGTDVEPSPRAVTVHGPQWPQGHILVEPNPNVEYRRNGGVPVIFCDLGPVLDLWSGQGATLTTDSARELGQALIEWADRRAS